MEIQNLYLYVKERKVSTYLYWAKTKEWNWIEYGLITLPKYMKVNRHTQHVALWCLWPIPF